MIATIDQLGDRHELVKTPCRIVSLVPSITELLCDLGLRDKVVGCTKFCVHPKGFKKSITIVGGTKKVNITKVIDLQPDFIIANKEENTKEDIEALRLIAPVWVSDIDTVERGLDMVRSIGALCSAEERTSGIIEASASILSSDFAEVKRVAYLIWRSPYMTIGGDTYIHDVLNRSGFENVFGESLRYPEVSIDVIKSKQPEVIFLSSEPFPFKQRHVEELKEQLGQLPIVLVDGEYFSWYGSRVIHCKDYISLLRQKIKNEKQNSR